MKNGILVAVRHNRIDFRFGSSPKVERHSSDKSDEVAAAAAAAAGFAESGITV